MGNIIYDEEKCSISIEGVDLGFDDGVKFGHRILDILDEEDEIKILRIDFKNINMSKYFIYGLASVASINLFYFSSSTHFENITDDNIKYYYNYLRHRDDYFENNKNDKDQYNNSLKMIVNDIKEIKDDIRAIKIALGDRDED